MIAVSLMSEAPSYEKISGLTFGTMSDNDKATTRASWTKSDVALSVLVIVLILVAYLSFTG
jgi:SSS family solute:Na+ symporter